MAPHQQHSQQERGPLFLTIASSRLIVLAITLVLLLASQSSQHGPVSVNAFVRTNHIYGPQSRLSFIPNILSSILEAQPFQKSRVIRERVLTLPNDRIFIRQATLAELPSVIALRVSVFHPDFKTVASYHKRCLEKTRERVQQGSIILIAYRNEHGEVARNNGFFGNVVGTIELSPNDFNNTCMEGIGALKKLYVADLAVRSDARRLGLATSLLSTIDEYAKSNGYGELFLHVDKINPQAQELYIKNGYRHLGVSDFATHFTEHRLNRDATNYHFLYKTIRCSQTASSFQPLRLPGRRNQAKPLRASAVLVPVPVPVPVPEVSPAISPAAAASPAVVALSVAATVASTTTTAATTSTSTTTATASTPAQVAAPTQGMTVSI